MAERVGTIMRDPAGRTYLLQPLDRAVSRRSGAPLVGEVLDVDDERRFRGPSIRHRVEVPDRAYGLAERMVRVAERGQMAMIAFLVAAVIAAVWALARQKRSRRKPELPG